MVCLTTLLAQAVGAVSQHHSGDTKPCDGLGIPEVSAGHEGSFLLQRHLLD